MKIDWEALLDYDDITSVTLFVEKNDVKIRDIYMKGINSIESIKVSGVNIYDLFNWDDGFNFLKMSILFEKSYFKTPKINDLIKLVGVKILIEENNIRNIFLINAPPHVSNELNKYCKKNKIFFENSNKSKINLSKIFFKFTPIYFISIAWFLKYCFVNWSHKKFDWQTDENSIFAMGYYTHINKFDLHKRKFNSGMWGSFLDYFPNSKFNFLHHFTPNSTTKNIDQGIDQLSYINSKDNIHNFINSFVTLKSIIEVLIIYTLKYIKSFFFLNQFLKNINNIFGFDIFNFIGKDVRYSLNGINLIHNIYWCVHFNHIFLNLRHQKAGFFLMENQGWEFAFVDAWKKYNHGKLFALQQSTLSFWDLRYLYPYDNRKYSPDFYLVNSFYNNKFFKDNNYPENKVYLIETLRYYYLKDLKTNNNSKSVLILGGIVYDATNLMVNSVAKIIDNHTDLSFYFKPHPAVDFDPNYNRFEIVHDDMSLLLQKHSIIICPSSSGVALEAFSLGLQVIVFLNPGQLNTSPIRGYDSVCFASNSSQISNALRKKKSIIQNHPPLEFKTQNSKFKDLLKIII